MKLLTFTTLYPDSTRPRHGIFIETRLRQLLAAGGMEAVVLAPVPWFPWRHPLFGAYAAYARVAHEEEHHGIRVLHPRYPLLPRVGMTLAPFVLAAAAFNAARGVIAHGYDFDVIDAHYFYPDGVAAAMLAKWLNKPLVVSARGSDINLIPQYYVPRKLIRRAAEHAARVIAVSQALRERLLELGVEQAKIAVLRNGVDTRVFFPAERSTVRQRLGWDGTVLLCVGNLVPEKGHDIAISALTRLPDAMLVIVGDGPESHALLALAQRTGVAERVRFVPPLAQEILRDYYSAADVLVLASSREGWPNVLLEAMACGTPVAVSRVGGAAEIVCAPEAGRLFEERTPQALADAINALVRSYPDRAATRRHAERFGWEEVVQGQAELYRQVIARHRILHQLSTTDK